MKVLFCDLGVAPVVFSVQYILKNLHLQQLFILSKVLKLQKSSIICEFVCFIPKLLWPFDTSV